MYYVFFASFKDMPWHVASLSNKFLQPASAIHECTNGTPTTSPTLPMMGNNLGSSQ
jgi:hypothetical protein